MFGEKPRTYQDIVRMKTCQQLQARFPVIDEETLRKIYDCMEQHPRMNITISGGVVHFAEGSGQSDIFIGNTVEDAATWIIRNGSLFNMTNNRGSGGDYDSGTSGNNNNNTNNNNNNNNA